MAGSLALIRRLYLAIYNWTVFVGWFVFVSQMSCCIIVCSVDHIFLCTKIVNLSLFICRFRFQVLYFALKTLKESGHEQVYDAVERPLQLAQTAAILEVHTVQFYIISFIRCKALSVSASDISCGKFPDRFLHIFRLLCICYPKLRLH